MRVNGLISCFKGLLCAQLACLCLANTAFVSHAHAALFEKSLSVTSPEKNSVTRQQKAAQDNAVRETEAQREHLRSVIEQQSFDADTTSTKQTTDLQERFNETKKTLELSAPQKKILNLELNKAIIDDKAPAQTNLQTKPQTNQRVQLESSADVLDALNQQDIFDIAKALHPNAKAMSIESVRQKALSQNLSLNITMLAPEIAQTFVSEERAKFDQVIFASAQVLDMNQDFISGDTVQFSSFDPLLDDARVKLTQEATRTKYVKGEAGIAVPLQTGAVVTVGADFANKKINNDFPTNDYNGALRFSVSQPLLRNAGVAVNTASIRIAEFNQRAVDAQTKLQSIRIIATIDKAYWALYQAWLSLAVRQQQYLLASQNYAMVERRVAEGLSARIELNRANIGVADRVNALVMAKTQLKIAQRQLQFYLNEVGSEVEAESLMPTTPPNLTGFQFDRERLVTNAMDERLDLLAQELQLAAETTKVSYLENQTLPLFTLDYRYGALSNTTDRLSDSFQRFNNPYNEWALGFKFEMPLSNEARRSQLNRAVIERTQRLSTQALQSLTVKREILDALDFVDQDWTRIAAARQQVAIAGVNYSAELKQFNEGLRTMTEVIESLTQLGESQLREVQAVTDYQISLIDLAFATGTLFGYSQVNIQ